MEEKGTTVYISVLTDTLQKKITLLEMLKQCDSLQSNLLDQNSMDVEAFEKAMEEKEVMFKKLEELDQGFESIYGRVNDELKRNKSGYAKEILKMQELIRKIAACSADIQVLEERNKAKFQSYLSVQRNAIKLSMRSRKTAGAYYRNMADQHQEGQSYFMDKKK